MAILLGTANSRGLISTVHLNMVVALLEHVRVKRPKLVVQHKISSCALPGFARNALASTVLSDPNLSHLLLVDPDISVSPETVLAMLDFDQSVVACPYPARDWDRQAFADAARRVEDPAVAEACAITYVGGDDDLLFGEDGKLVTRGPFARVTGCGAGLLLIKRAALQTIAQKRPDMLLNEPRADYAKLGYTGARILECFEHASNTRSDEAVEGRAFAKLWTGLGGEVWAHMEAVVTRFSEHRFVGHFASKLKLGMI
jgi:hypothetical protein